MRRVAFSVDLLHPVLGVTRRSGYLVEGPAGWTCSPLASWNRCRARGGGAFGARGRNAPFPDAVRERVAVNAMIPRLAPDIAAELALASGCMTIKVKVGDEDSVDRVAAVRAAHPRADPSRRQRRMGDR